MSARCHDQPEAHPEREQVAHCDRPLGGHRVLERPVEALENRVIGELGQQAIDRLVEPKPAFLDEEHRRCRRNRLGHRADPEDRVAPDRLATGERGGADRIDVQLAASRQQRDDSGHCAALDTARHDVVHAVEARLQHGDLNARASTTGPP